MYRSQSNNPPEHHERVITIAEHNRRVALQRATDLTHGHYRNSTMAQTYRKLATQLYQQAMVHRRLLALTKSDR